MFLKNSFIILLNCCIYEPRSNTKTTIKIVVENFFCPKCKVTLLNLQIMYNSFFQQV